MTVPPPFRWADYARECLGGGRGPAAGWPRDEIRAALEAWRATRGEVSEERRGDRPPDPARALTPLRLPDAEFDDELSALVRDPATGAEPPAADPAASSLPGGPPTNVYIRGPRYRVAFDRIVTPRFTSRPTPAVATSPVGEAAYEPLNGGGGCGGELGRLREESAEARDRLISGLGVPAALLGGQEAGALDPDPVVAAVALPLAFTEAQVAIPGTGPGVGLLVHDVRIRRPEPPICIIPGRTGRADQPVGGYPQRADVTFGRVVAPAAVLDAFQRRYGDVGRAAENVLEIRTGAGVVRLSGVVLGAMSCSIQADDDGLQVVDGMQLVASGEITRCPDWNSAAG